MGTDYFMTGDCKYYLRHIDLDGDDIKVRFQCVFIDAQYNYESVDFFPEMIPGNYAVADMISEQVLLKGTGPDWETYEEFLDFAEQYQPGLSGAGTGILTLFKDEGGIHIRY